MPEDKREVTARCTAATMGNYCGFPLNPDGTCPNSNMHRDVFEALHGDDSDLED
jgi:hypothetical protein